MPRIEMTPTVRWSLFFLRVYLIVMLGLITWKFIATSSKHVPAAAPAATPAPVPAQHG